MNVLVDTSVWSLALRRPTSKVAASTQELVELIREGRVVMFGPVRQELLSGIESDAQFRTIRNRLRAFADLPLDSADYEEAAACFNRCRRNGVAGSNTDFLICAVAIRRDLAVLTTDRDFDRYSKLLPVHLHQTRRASQG